MHVVCDVCVRTDANGPVIEGKIHEPGTFFVKLAKEPNVAMSSLDTLELYDVSFGFAQE